MRYGTSVRWLLLLGTVTLLELVALWQVGLLVGFWPVVALVGVTGLLGGSLAKREGLRVWNEWTLATRRGEVPAVGLVDGLLVLLGGLLLLSPGLLGDVVGLVLLIPPTRRVVAGVVRARLQARMPTGAGGETSADATPGTASFGSFTVFRGGPSGFSAVPFGRDETLVDRRDADVVIIDTTGETVDEPPPAPLALPPGR